MADHRDRVRRRSWRQVLILTRVAARSAVQYRANVASAMVGGIAYQGSQLLFIGVLLAKFDHIAGWSLREVGLVFAIRLAAHVVYTLPFSQLWSADQVIRDGEYDRYLLRPANPFVQLLTRQLGAMQLGDLVLGVAALAAFAPVAPVAWTPWRVCYLLLAVVGGGLVEAGIQTALTGMSFVTTTTAAARNLVDTTMTQFGGLPLSIFGRWPLYVFATAFPMAYIAYLPGTVLLGRTAEVPLPGWLCLASPLAGPAAFWLGYRAFVALSRHYRSPSGG